MSHPFLSTMSLPTANLSAFSSVLLPVTSWSWSSLDASDPLALTQAPPTLWFLLVITGLIFSAHELSARTPCELSAATSGGAL